MRNQRAIFAAGFLSLLASLSFAWAQDNTDDPLRPVLEKRYAEMRKAMAGQDSQTFAAILAPDCVSEDVQGNTTSASNVIKEVGATPPDNSRVSETTLLSIKTEGDRAIVEQRYHMTTTRPLPEYKTQVIELVTLSTDTWINSGGQWLLQKTVTNQLDYTVNGKNVAHKVHAPRAQ